MSLVRIFRIPGFFLLVLHLENLQLTASFHIGPKFLTIILRLDLCVCREPVLRLSLALKLQVSP